MRKTRRIAAPATPAALLAATFTGAALLSGCAPSGASISPTATTLGQSSSEINNDLAITWDTTLRALLEDIGRATYQDRPDRLSPRAIPY